MVGLFTTDKMSFQLYSNFSVKSGTQFYMLHTGIWTVCVRRYVCVYMCVHTFIYSHVELVQQHFSKSLLIAKRLPLPPFWIPGHLSPSAAPPHLQNAALINALPLRVGRMPHLSLSKHCPWYKTHTALLPTVYNQWMSRNPLKPFPESSLKSPLPFFMPA